MIRIGDFAKLNRVSVKTLRLYDELGLIKPVRVDEFSGYRYYDYDQYPLMSRIRALKDLGFSLEEIGHLLLAGISSEQMRAMLRLRGAEIRQRIGEEQGRLARVEAWMGQLEKEGHMSTYDVVVKQVEAVRTACIRGVVPQPADQSSLWRTLFEYLGEKGVELSAPCISLYYDEEPPDKNWDIEVCAPIEAELPERGDIYVRDLDAVETMATVLHAGPFVTITEAYASLWKWVNETGHRIIGPAREVVLRPPAMDGNGANQTDPCTIVEIQFPIEKVAASTRA